MSDSPVIDYEAPDAEPEPPRGAMLSLFVTVFMDLLGFGVIIPSLPFYATHFHADPVRVTLMFTLFSLCQLIATPILGTLSDRYGRRPVLIFSQIGSVAGYLLLGYVTSRDWNNLGLALMLIYASRIIDGISGGNISTAQAYIADITTGKTRAKGMACSALRSGLGSPSDR